MKSHPGLRRERRLHNRANPWILGSILVIAAVLGFFLEKRGVALVRIGDSSMAPRWIETEPAPACLLQHCIKHLAADDALLIRTPDRMKIRKVGGLPGEWITLRNHPVAPLPSEVESTDLLLPRQGDVTDPTGWSRLAFDALISPLAAELDTVRQREISVILRWIGGKEIIEEREVSIDEAPPFSEMERHGSVLKSHRPGVQIRWERQLLDRGELLRIHRWKRDHYLLIPETKGWSWWVLPQDSISGKMISFSGLPF